MTDAKTKRGLQVFSELMGAKAAAEFEKGLENTGFGSAITKLAAEYCFADVWGRDTGLERAERSLVILSVLLAQRQTAEFKNHVRIGLNNGLKPKQIEEVLIQALPYVGFPAIASAMTATIEVFREKGINPDLKTSEERGLL